MVTQSSLMGAGAVTTEMMAASHTVAPEFIEPPRETSAATIEYPALEIETEESSAGAELPTPLQALRGRGYADERAEAGADWLTAEDVPAEMAESHAGEYLAAESLVAESVVAEDLAAEDRADAREWPEQRFEFAREEDVTDVAEPAGATSFDDAVAVEAMPEPRGAIEPEPVDAQAEGFVAATDPWQNPLPAWEYSQNEWPVMLAPKNERRHKKRLTLIAAVLLLALLAGLYFFVTRPGADTTPEGDEARPAEPVSAPPASPQEQSPSAAISTAAQATPEPASAAPQQPAAQQAAAPQATSEQPAPAGRYSLQASASPSQAEAEDFAARLRQAGLPAYVVSADLGRKGVWYRVRVGGFESAQDAARFIAQAKERARASGVALKGLNVVEN